MLTQDFFKKNRRRLAKSVNGELVIVTANGAIQRSADTAYPFRQDSNFYYLTGVGRPDVLLVIKGETEFLVLPKQTKAEVVFGGKIDEQLLSKQSGVKSILPYAEGNAQIKILLSNAKTIHTLLAPPAKVVHSDSFYTNPARRNLVTKLKRWKPVARFSDLRRNIASMRQIKQPQELQAIKKAIDCTAEGFGRVRSELKRDLYEYEIQAILDQEFRSQNMGHGYEPIVAGGKNACTLHYIANDSVLQKHQLLLIDAGAEYNNYSADITRTYPVEDSSISQRQKDVISAVKSIQDQLLDQLKPGMTWKQYDGIARDATNRQLLQLGLIKSASDKKARSYFPHSIGHSLGLDVHDICDYQSLLENMVITCEPGIYIPEEGIGVRIEDDIHITKNGCANLSSHIPY